MAKTAQDLRNDLRTMVISRATDQLLVDYALANRLANTADDAGTRAAWVVTLVAMETELNDRGIETCEVCAWPAGDHDPELCA